MNLEIVPAFRPVLDPAFVPAVLWNRAYRAKVAADPAARTLDLALSRQDGTTFRWSGRILSQSPENDPLTLRYIERHVKFLLWQKGGSRLSIAGAPEVAAALSAIYSETGDRSFDWGFIGTRIFGEPIRVEAVELARAMDHADSAPDYPRPKPCPAHRACGHGQGAS